METWTEVVCQAGPTLLRARLIPVLPKQINMDDDDDEGDLILDEAGGGSEQKQQEDKD